MKLLIIRPSALGDTLMLMPAIAQLRGSTEIVLVGRSPGIDIISPYVNRVMDYEGSGWHRLFLDNLDAYHAFSPPEADCAVAFLTDPDGRVNKNLKTTLPRTRVHFFPAFPPQAAHLHVALYLAQCLKSAGLPIDPEKSLEDASRGPLLKRENLAIQREKIVFHPGSGGKGKNHPPEFWLALISALNTHFLSPPFHKPIILLGPAEEGLRAFFTTNLSLEGMEILFAPELKQLQSILTQAPLYVGHDSGITHLAAMLGTPTVALFKNSPVPQWRPLGPAVKVIQSKGSGPDLISEIIEKGTSLLKRR